jgi:hypothetical protein
MNDVDDLLRSREVAAVRVLAWFQAIAMSFVGFLFVYQGGFEVPVAGGTVVETYSYVGVFLSEPYSTVISVFSYVLLLVFVADVSGRVLEHGPEDTDVGGGLELTELRDRDEIVSKLDELDAALESPANDLELLANRGARDALHWSVGLDKSVVTDVESYERRHSDEQGEA